MICNTVYKYCCDDISLIENYEEALNSKETYDCHHRFEIDKNMSVNQLIKENLYYNRPANELIFLSKTEHRRLHLTGKRKTEEQIEKQSIISKELHKTKRIGMYGRHHSEDSKLKSSISNKEFLKYHKHHLLGKHRVYDENGKYHYE